MSNPAHHQRNVPRQRSFQQPLVNPFIHKLSLTPLQKLQVAIMSVTIAPLRLILVATVFFVTWFFNYIFTLGMPVHLVKPVGPFRKALLNTFRYAGRVFLFFIGFHWIHIRGKRAPITEAPLLVAAPHSSMFDVLVSFVTDPLPSSVSRIENYETPFAGTLCMAVQAVFVSRKDPNSRRKTIDEIKRRAGMPGEWPQILIFPEGTCTNRKSLITFKAGAFIPAVPVQPVVVEYFNDLDTFTWTWNGPGGLKLLWLSLCQPWLKVRITYLPVYKPNEREREDPKLFANNVRMVMAETLGVPCTDHTFEDCRLMGHAASLNLPLETGLVEFTKLSRKLGMDIDGVKEHLSEFARIACERSDGKISIEDFARFLNLPITPALQDMFDLYDRNKSGLIDFREYVIGLSLVSQPAATKETVKLAFQVFDKDQNGMISENEFVQVLYATFGDEIDSHEIFSEIKKSCPDRVTFEEFHSFVIQRPEYAKLFVWYHDMGQDNDQYQHAPEEMNEEIPVAENHSSDSVTKRRSVLQSNRVEDSNAGKD